MIYIITSAIKDNVDIKDKKKNYTYKTILKIGYTNDNDKKSTKDLLIIKQIIQVMIFYILYQIVLKTMKRNFIIILKSINMIMGMNGFIMKMR